MQHLPKQIRDTFAGPYSLISQQKKLLVAISLFSLFLLLFAFLPDKNTLESYDMEMCLNKWGRLHVDSDDDMNKVEGSCPRSMPESMRDAYTLNGKIGVHPWYQCQTGPQYDKKHEYTTEQIDEYVQLISQRRPNYYGNTDLFLYNSIDNYPIGNRSVVIMGSQRPIYESVCLVFGGSSCTTIDFQPIICKDERLKFITIAEFDKSPKMFDAAISISSFEHDGLGRYGDPLRPNGDLDMMKKMKCIVKPDGILYLSVPLAKDKIVWNMHRVYGQVRLPLLLKHWTLLDVFGDKYQMIRRYSGCDAGGEGDYQPILVLQNREPEEGHNERILNQYIDENLNGKDISCFN